MVRRDPVERFPLVARKNLRDSWENTKQEHENQLSDILGQPWTISVDPKAIYAYVEPDSWGSTCLGDVIVSYVDGAKYQLKNFLERNGTEARDEINDICSAHVLTLDVDETNTFSYCGARVSPQGELLMVFNERNLGTNIDSALEFDNLTKALNEAPSTARPMSFVARTSIRNDYEPHIKEVQEELNKILGQDVAVVPNFEANFEKLKGDTDADSSWERNFGSAHLSYFTSLVSQLKYDKFSEDDMLQEALLEAIEKRAVHFRVVDKTTRSYNETVVEDGVLYLQTAPKDFYCNVDQISSDLMNIL
ncbi:hypothetical protein FHETE_11113 [Fusarium heterosporum]|uniref:Uncharacterized protein n=1 Tax=Fusarium heterosporum TaxID=42747 RepID=A0A8H5WDG9_FUSHE|nr:hypothetical protein FHETE_11113 [Fusarium heterosporum]